MRAILIDAVEKTVREVEYTGKLQSAYGHLRCDLVDIVSLPVLATGRGDSGHSMLVDDEGLLKGEDDPDAPFFMFRNGWTFAGSGLVTGGADDDGNAMPATMPVEDIARNVAFASRAQLQAIGAEPKPGFKFFAL